MTLEIAIVGGGPVGCMLARILIVSNADVSITIFEGEADATSRWQGGTLDLRQTSGLIAIRAAKLEEAFEKYARYDGESLLITDQNLNKWVQMTGDSGNKNARAPEIDRFQLRQILQDSLPADCIQWNTKVARVVPSPTKPGRHFIEFANGKTSPEYDLVVGADGAWSKVRPLLTSTKPSFSSVGGFTLTVRGASKAAPELAKLIDHGNLVTMHDGIFMTQQQMSDDHVQTNVFWKNPKGGENWSEDLPFESSDVLAVKKYLLEEKLSGWNPRLKDLIADSPADAVSTQAWSLYELPIGHRWTHHPGVTLVGDAAHVMTPFAGEGVNQGFLDAVQLAESIVKHGEAHDLAAFEQKMFSRMQIFMTQTQTMKANSFFPGPLSNHIEEYMLAAVQDELPLPTLTLPIARAVCFAYFAWFRWWYKPAL